MRYCCDAYEDPDCGCCDEAALPDEDLIYEEARDHRAFGEEDSNGTSE